MILQPINPAIGRKILVSLCFSFRGSMWDVTVKNLSAFEVEQLNMSVNVFSLDATLQSTFTWPDIRITGHYNVDGILQDIMTFFGKGPFQ